MARRREVPSVLMRTALSTTVTFLRLLSVNEEERRSAGGMLASYCCGDTNCMIPAAGREKVMSTPPVQVGHITVRNITHKLHGSSEQQLLKERFYKI